MKQFIFMPVLIFFSLYVSTASAYNNVPATLASIPVYYPEDTIGSRNPFFIWFDENNKRDKNDNVRYKITLKSKKAQEIKSEIIRPELFYDDYYFFKWPFSLEPDNYEYTIERLSNSKPSNAKYFRYLKYPLIKEFEINESEKSVKDDLQPEKLIQYLKLEKENKLVNRNNFYFYSAASAGSFGIGLLFYKVLDFGFISKIIYYAAFTSSVAGAGTAGYYGVNYLIEKNNLQKIADFGKDVSINGNLSSTGICFDFKIQY